MPMTVAAQIGFSSGSFASFDFTGANTDNQVATQTVALPFSGRLGRLWAFFAGDGVSVTARIAAWRNSDGAVAARTAQFSAPSGSHATGGQTLNTNLHDGSGLRIGSDDAAIFGFWRAPAASSVWSVAGSGTFVFKTDLSGDVGSMAGDSVCGGTFVCGNIQAYGTLHGGDARVASKTWPAYLRARRRC